MLYIRAAVAGRSEEGTVGTHEEEADVAIAHDIRNLNKSESEEHVTQLQQLNTNKQVTKYVHICSDAKTNRLLDATWHTCHAGRYTCHIGVYTYKVAPGISSEAHAFDTSRWRGTIRVGMARFSPSLRTRYWRIIVLLPAKVWHSHLPSREWLCISYLLRSSAYRSRFSHCDMCVRGKSNVAYLVQEDKCTINTTAATTVKVLILLLLELLLL